MELLNKLMLTFGYFVAFVIVLYFGRYFLRGLSYGLYSFVLSVKCGVPVHRCLRMLLIGLLWRPIQFALDEGVAGVHTESVTNSLSGWYGIFEWSFSDKIHRGLYKEELESRKRRQAEEQL